MNGLIIKQAIRLQFKIYSVTESDEPGGEPDFKVKG